MRSVSPNARWFILILSLLAGLGASCRAKTGVELPRGTSGPLDSLDALRPQAGEAKSKLLLAGTEISVTAKQAWTGDDLLVELITHGQVVEEERYAYSNEAILLVEAASERYEPGLPILKAPIQLGDGWKWKGVLRTGDIKHTAEAEIVTDIDTLFDVRTTVSLAIDGGGPQPAKRTLAFWFEAGQGVAKREFGAGSTRIPVSE